MVIFNNTYNYRDLGLLILRVGIGGMFVMHGLPKIMGGEEAWIKVGSAMQIFGVNQFPEVWGYLAAFAECGGGILLVFGMLHRAVCFLLFFTMFVASAKHLGAGDGVMGASHAIESGILFLSLMLIGPGKVSIDQKIFTN